MVLVQQSEERGEGILLEDVVAALGAVAGDVTQSPDSLLAHVQNRGGEKLDEDGHCALVDDHLGVVRSA